MKNNNLKLELDLKNIFSSYDDEEEGYSISDILKNQISSYLYNQTVNKIQTDINTYLGIANKTTLDELIKTEFDRIINQKLTEPKIKEDQRGSKLISIEEYIDKVFAKNNSDYVLKHITDLTKKLGDELKQRYDLKFASMIVNNLNKQGLLKEGVMDSLINKD